MDTSANTVDLGTNYSLVTGEPVTYNPGLGNTSVGGLTRGTTYYVITVTGSTKVKLATSLANAVAGTPVAVDLTSVGLGTQTLSVNVPQFDAPSAVSTSASTIDLGANYALVTGEAVAYSAGVGNTAIGGLTDGNIYYVIPVTNSTKVQLASSLANAVARIAIVFTTTGTGSQTLTVQSLFDASGVVSVSASTIDLGVNYHLTAGTPITYNPGTGNTVIGGLTSGTTYYVIPIANSTKIQLATSATNAMAGTAITFTLAGVGTQGFALQGSGAGQQLTPTGAIFDASAVVSTSANTIDLGANYGLVTGETVTYNVETGNTAIGGLTGGTTFYVILVPNSTKVKLASSLANALAGTAITLTSAGTGVQALTPTKMQFSGGASIVDTTANTIDLGVASGLQTGDSIKYQAGSGNTAIGGLTSGTTYYVIAVPNTTKIQLAASQGGPAITLSATGSGANQALIPTASDNLQSLMPLGVQVTANSNEKIVAVAIGVGGAATSQELAVGAVGSGAGNYVTDTTQALIQNHSNVTANGGGVALTALDQSNEIAVAGAIAFAISLSDGGAAVAIGVSAASNSVGTSSNPDAITAKIDNSTVLAGGGVSLNASSSPTITAVTIAGSVDAQTGGGFAVGLAGAGSGNTIFDSVQALISDGSTVTTLNSQDVSLTARQDASITADAGGISLGLVLGEGGASIQVGAAAATNNIGSSSTSNVVQASIDDSIVHSDGRVLLTTTAGDASSEQIYAEAFGIAGALAASEGGGVALAGAGSGSGNSVYENVESSVKNGSTVTTNHAGDFTATATDYSKIHAGAGAGALAIAAGEGAGIAGSVGVSVAVNQIGNTVTAGIEGSTVNSSGGVSLDAEETASIYALTVAGSVSVGGGETVGVAFAGAGAGSGNSIINTVQAIINGGSSVTTSNDKDVMLTARDDASITADAGGFSVGIGIGEAAGAGAIGAAQATNNIGTSSHYNVVLASIDGSTVTSDGNVTLTATGGDSNKEQIDALAVGIAGSLAAGEGGGLALSGAGSGAGNTVYENIEASIKNNSTVSTHNHGNVTLTATDNTKIKAGSGSGVIAIGIGASSVGAAVGIGVSVAGSDINNIVTAAIEGSTVHADGGVALSATETATITTVTVAGGVVAGVGEDGGVAFAGAGAGSNNTINNTVQALINGGSIVTSGSGDDVSATATDTPSITADGGGVSIAIAGGIFGSLAVGIGAGVAVNNITDHVYAGIDNSAVTSAGRVTLTTNETAYAKAEAFGVAIAGSLAIGTAAAAGSGANASNTVNDTVESYIQDGSTVLASASGADAVSLTATDNTTAIANGGAGSLGVGIGIGAGLAVGAVTLTNSVGNIVEAFIGEDTTAGDDNKNKVTSAGGVKLTASSTQSINATGVAVAASVGFVGASGSGAGATNTTTNTIAALIRNDSTVIAGNTVALSATDTPTITSIIGEGALSVGIFGGSIGASVATSTMGDTVNAAISNSTVTVTGGGVTVASNSTTSISTQSVATNVSISIGGALSVTTATSKDNTTTEASIAGGSTTATGSVNVTSTSNGSATANADGGTGGIVAVSSLISDAEVNGSTLASIGEGTTVNAGSVSVVTNSTTTTTANTVAVSIGGLSTLGSNATSTITRDEEAFIGPKTGATATGSATRVNAGSGTVQVMATSNNTANATVGGGLAGLADIAVLLDTTNLGGSTNAYVGGNTTITAGEVDVTASATNVTQPEAILVDINVSGTGLGVSGDGANCTANMTHTVSAYVASGSTVNVTAGKFEINATSNNTVSSNASGASVGATVSIAAMLAESNLDGSTQAYVGGNDVIHAGEVDVFANSTNNASASSVLVGISDVGGAGANVTSTVNHTTKAYIAAGSQVTVTGGSLNVQATSGATSTANAHGGTGGIVNVAVLVNSATINDTTEAYVGEGSTVSASSLNVTANTTTQTATATTVVIGISVLGAGAGSNTTSTVEGKVEAYVAAEPGTTASGSTTTLNITGPVSITAASVSNDTVNETVGAGGAIAGAGGTSTVTDSMTVTAAIGDNTQLTASGVVVTATSTDVGSDTAIIGSGGVLSVRVDTAEADVTPTISAYAGNNVQMTVSGAVDVEATSVRAEGHADAQSYGGGGIDVGVAVATEKSTPTVSAYLGTSTTVTAGGDVTVKASALSTSSPQTYNDQIAAVNVTTGAITFPSHGLQTGNTVVYSASNSGNAALKVLNGGSLDGRSFKVIVLDANTVQFGDVFNGGSVDASAPFSTNQGVDSNLNEVAFGANHDFLTGDAVVYDSEGNPTIGSSLTSGSTYYVRAVSPSAIKLYTSKSAATDSGYSFTPNPGAVSFPVSSVIAHTASSNADSITLAGNSFTNGEQLVYTSSSGNPVAGLTSGNTYYVVSATGSSHLQLANAVNGSAIQLTPASGSSATLTLTPAGAIVNSTFTSNPDNFTNGEAVVYQAPAPTTFATSGVNTNSSGAASAGANDIYAPGNNYVAGEQVTYNNNSTSGEPVGGLTNGGIYYIVNPMANTIQLATSPGGTPITLTPVTSGAALSANLSLTRPAIGGLVSGYTYYVETRGSGFQLAATSGGTPITLTPGSLGLHTLYPDGVALSGASGTQAFHLALGGSSTNSPTGDKLFASGGVSLRLVTPPSGTGQSSATAEGGSGGVVGVSIPTANLTLTPTVNAYVNAGKVTSGGNVTIASESIGNSNAYANNGGGGGIYVASSTATTSFTNNNTASIGSNAQITALGNFALTSDTQLTTSMASYSDGGGLVAVIEADDTANATSTTSVTVGTGVTISGATVKIDATVSNIGVSETPSSKGGGLFGGANANTTSNVTSTASVTTNNGDSITGQAGMDVRALHQNFNPNLDPSALFIGIGNGGQTSKNYNNSLTDLVRVNSADANLSLVTAGARGTGTPLATVDKSNNALPANLALYAQADDVNVDSTHSTENRSVLWDANVTITAGPTPELIVDQNGNIVLAENVSVDDNGTTRTSGQIQDSTIVVNPISGLSRGGVLLSAPDLVNNVTRAGRFTFEDAASSVTIINQSPKALQVGAIDVTAQGMTQPTVTLNSNSISIQFSIVPNAGGQTSVDIENQNTALASSNITLTGLINNPDGTTTIKNVRGDILAASASAIVRSNILDEIASGSLGSYSGYLNDDLVESTDSSGTRYPLLTATATSGSAYLNLSGRRRDVNSTPLTVYGSTISAGQNVNLQLQSGEADALPTTLTQGITVTANSGSLSGSYSSFFHPDPNTATTFPLSAVTSGTATTGANTITVANNNFTNGEILNYSHTGNDEPIGGLTNRTNYYVVNQTPTTIQLAATFGGTPITLTPISTTTDVLSLTPKFTFDSGLYGDPTQATTLPVTFLFGNTDAFHNLTGTGGITAGGNISIQGAHTAASDPMVTVAGIIQTSPTGKTDATINGSITLTESTGNLNVGVIDSINGTVTLTAPGSIVVGNALATTNLTGNTVTLTAQAGTIGTASAVLQIVTSASGTGALSASATQGIYLNQTSGTLNVLNATTTRGAIVVSNGAIGSARDINLPTNDVIRTGSGAVTLTGDAVHFFPNSTVQATGNITIDSGSLTTDTGSTILATGNGSTLDVENSGAVALTGTTEVNGTGSDVIVNTTTFELMATGQVEALNANGTITINALDTLTLDANSAVEGGSYFPAGQTTPVAGYSGGSVALTSTHEMLIAGSVTTSNLLTITAGSAAHDDSAFFASTGGYLVGESQYSFLLTGTLDAFGSATHINITAPDAVIVTGQINTTADGNAVQLQSNKWVYVSGQVEAANSLEILGGVTTNGVSLNGANSRGMSVYVDSTALLETTAPGSQFAIQGAEHVRFLGVAVAGGTVGTSGIAYATPRLASGHLVGSVTFTPNSTGDVITRNDHLTWTSSGFAVGQQIVVSGTTGNDGVYTIASISGSSMVLTAHQQVTAETDTTATLNGSADASLTVNGGDQVYVGGALNAAGVLQVINSTTPGANDSGLGVVVNTAGGLSSLTEVAVSSVGSVQIMGNVLSGGTRTSATAPVTWTGTNAGVLVQSRSQTQVGGQLRHAVTGLTFAQNSGGDVITRNDGFNWQDDNFQVNESITIADTAHNNGTYTIQSLNGSQLVVTAVDQVTAETDASATVTSGTAFTSGYIQASQLVELLGVTDSSDTGVLVQSGSEVTTQNAAGAVVIHSASDAEIDGIVLPGGTIVHTDSQGNSIGQQLQNYGGNSTLQIVAGNTIRLGTDLEAGKSISLVAGAPGTNPNDNNESINLIGSVSVQTWASNSSVTMNAPGEILIEAPALKQIVASGSIASTGILTSDVTLALTVTKADGGSSFTYQGNVTIPSSVTTSNSSIYDLITEIQTALNTTSYTVTAADATHALNSSYTEFAQTPANPDIQVMAVNGQIVFLGGGGSFTLGATSSNANLLGLPTLPVTASGIDAVAAAGSGSTVSIGSASGSNQKIDIAGNILADAGITVNSGFSTDNSDFVLEGSGSLTTNNGSITANIFANGAIHGQVLAQGSGADATLAAGNTLTIDGMVEAQHHVVLTAGTNPAPGTTSISITSLSQISSLGAGGEILVTGLNNVDVNGSLQDGSVAMSLVSVTSTDGTVQVEQSSGNIHTAGQIQLQGQTVQIDGGVTNTSSSATAPAIDVLASTVNVTGTVQAVGSITFSTSGGTVNVLNGKVATSGAGQTVTLGAAQVNIGELDLTDTPNRNIGGVVTATHKVWIDATGTVTVAAGARVATSESGSTILIDSGALNVAGDLDAGATLSGSPLAVTFSGKNAGVQIVATGMVMVGGQEFDSSSNTTTAVGGNINATGTVAITQNGSVTVGVVVSALSSITSDATSFGAGLTGLTSPSQVTISTTQEAQIHGDVSATPSNAGTDSISITAGHQLYIDSFIDAGGQVVLQGGTDTSGISVFVAATYLLDTSGSIAADAHGNETFASGGEIETGLNGQISITGSQDVELDGIVGVTAFTSSVTVTATSGSVTVQGQLNARDSVTVGGGVNLLAGSIVQTQQADGTVTFNGPTGNILIAGASANGPERW